MCSQWGLSNWNSLRNSRADQLPGPCEIPLEWNLTACYPVGPNPGWSSISPVGIYKYKFQSLSRIAYRLSMSWNLDLNILLSLQQKSTQLCQLHSPSSFFTSSRSSRRLSCVTPSSNSTHYSVGNPLEFVYLTWSCYGLEQCLFADCHQQSLAHS